MREPKAPPRFLLTALFSVFVFGILLVTMVVVGSASYILIRIGVISAAKPEFALIVVGIASVLVGTALTFFGSKIPMRPANELIYGLNALAAGKYDTRLPTPNIKPIEDVQESFNLLAEELQNTELLRSDFVNNFSHEFKTPLVSIQGFARLLQRGDLSEEKTQECLNIIASESARLADMATKVLDLTRLENQSILTELSSYNLSEQLRECILLLERKWTKKELDISADFAEYQIRGNQEMLKQVWINLLDNAIKFSFPGETLEVAAEEREGCIAVSVSDQGTVIQEEERKRIFQKFYQADTSHTAQGNGIGLAIAQRIVTLHGGEIQVESSEARTVFTVLLPTEKKGTKKDKRKKRG